jgi:glycosyltransferase involved in cell wall biosynthesis
MEGGLRTRGIYKQNRPGLPLISVITVVYNRLKYLEEAILSVLKQTYNNIEYIVIDGGSTDGTLDIIKKYDNRIDYWISEPDKGMYFALNKGIQLTNGELIGICHSDDYYFSNEVIEHLVNMHEKENADVYHGDMISISDEGSSSDRIVSNADLITKTHNSIIHPTTFVKRELFYNMGFYNTKYRSAADYELMIRLKLAHCKFCHLGIIVCVMRIGSKDRISNNCYSHLEAYEFHKVLHTDNHFQYLVSYLRCIITKFAKSIFNKIGIYHK